MWLHRSSVNSTFLPSGSLTVARIVTALPHSMRHQQHPPASRWLKSIARAKRCREPARGIRPRLVVHVDLRGGKVGVPHPLLELAGIDRADGHTTEGVAQVVEAQRAQPGRVARPLEAAAQRGAVEVLPGVPDED